MNIESKLSLEYLPIAEIKKEERNPHIHPSWQIDQIAKSIQTFRFCFPISLDETNRIIAGYGRLLAAEKLGLKEIPIVRLPHLSPNQIKALRIADNKLTKNAKWDDRLLREVFLELSKSEIDFSLDITGFSQAEIDLTIEGLKDSNCVSDDFADEQLSIETKAISTVGDLWACGRHRILCGDALSEQSYAALMPDLQAHVAFIDPPYNVPIDGHASGNGSIHHREFPMAAGEMSESEFTAFLSKVLQEIKRKLIEGALTFICMDWRHQYELLSAARNNSLAQKNLAVWVKNNAGMGSFYRSQHELIFVLKHGQAPNRNNIELGKHGRSRSNVWNYAGINSGGRSSQVGDLLALHPTVKPVALIADALMDCTARGDIVLDSFLGSGSTLIAAERVGRICYGIELDPLYVDTAIRRWERLTGQQAIHVESNTSFVERSKIVDAA